MAWRPIEWPGTAVVAAHSARARARWGAVTVAEGGAGNNGSPMAHLPWGQGQGHEGSGRGAPCKMRNGATHRGGRASVRWRGEAGAVVLR
jgi:hypothetical protein